MDTARAAHRNRVGGRKAIKMRELRRWIVAFLTVEAAWITYLVIAFSATDIAVNEQPEMSAISSPYATPPAIFLICITALWTIAAIFRSFKILFRIVLRRLYVST